MFWFLQGNSEECTFINYHFLVTTSGINNCENVNLCLLNKLISNIWLYCICVHGHRCFSLYPETLWSSQIPCRIQCSNGYQFNYSSLNDIFMWNINIHHTSHLFRTRKYINCKFDSW